jgi:ribonuclease HI
MVLVVKRTEQHS